MFYDRHGAGPDETHYEAARFQMPNQSARMDALRAAILRPQLRLLEDNIARWNKLYNTVADNLRKSPAIAVPRRPQQEDMVGSSIQFRVPALDAEGCRALTSRCSDRGVQLKWFGNDEPIGFTSDHGSWRYFERQRLPRTDGILSTLFDMRLPLTFSPEDCALIADIILESVGTGGQ